MRLSPSKVQCIYCFKMYWCSEVHLLFPFSSARFMLNLQLPKWPKFFMIWDKFQTRWMFRRWRPRSRCFLFFWAQSSSCILMYSTDLSPVSSLWPLFEQPGVSDRCWGNSPALRVCHCRYHPGHTEEEEETEVKWTVEDDFCYGPLFF